MRAPGNFRTPTDTPRWQGRFHGWTIGGSATAQGSPSPEDERCSFRNCSANKVHRAGHRVGLISHPLTSYLATISSLDPLPLEPILSQLWALRRPLRELIFAQPAAGDSVPVENPVEQAGAEIEGQVDLLRIAGKAIRHGW